MSSLLKINQLTVELPTAQASLRLVNEVSLRIGAGESAGLVGESGAVMHCGRLVEIGDAEHLLHHPTQQYRSDLLAAVPEVSARH